MTYNQKQIMSTILFIIGIFLTSAICVQSFAILEQCLYICRQLPMFSTHKYRLYIYIQFIVPHLLNALNARLWNDAPSRIVPGYRIQKPNTTVIL